MFFERLVVFFTDSMFLLRPFRPALSTALFLNIRLKSPEFIDSIDNEVRFRKSSDGKNSSICVGFENLFHGQTSNHMKGTP